MSQSITLHLPADRAGELCFKKLTGNELLSQLYEFHVDCISKHHNIDMTSLLGEVLRINIPLRSGGYRYFHGNITHIDIIGHDHHATANTLYCLTIKPALWYLSQNLDYRIWQEKTVPEIVTELLSDHGIEFDNRLTGNYRRWQYCVQYQESSYSFISRLLEHEGIAFFFRHHQEGHSLVLADSPQAYASFPDYAHIPYQRAAMCVSDRREGIQHWRVGRGVTAAIAAVDDYDFRQPRARLAGRSLQPGVTGAGGADLTRFYWPGGYSFDAQPDSYARIRQQELSSHQQIAGEGDARGLAPGYHFTLDHRPPHAPQTPWLVTGVHYQLRDPRYDQPATADAPTDAFYARFTVIPATVQWRPARTTPWPKTCGPQTAEVTGPAGKTIWTDQYGRVKLKFRWDRHGKTDDTSSCWVRVSSSWAGWKYGAQQIPRIGEEVVVDFLYGDPDRPLITGRVYNQANMPPWALPANATRMGFMSRSSGGASHQASYLYFEDAPGREQVALHAERDLQLSAEQHYCLHVQGDLSQKIEGKSQSTFVGPSHRLTLQTDRQTFMQGSATVIAAGGKASLIHGGALSQIAGCAELHVSQHSRHHADDSISHHAGNNLLFDAGNQIIYGSSLHRDPPRSDVLNSACALLWAGSDAKPPTPGIARQADDTAPHPTRVLFSKGRETRIAGHDRLQIEGSLDRSVEGDVSQQIQGNCHQRVKQQWQLQVQDDMYLQSDQKITLKAHDLNEKIGGSITSHCVNRSTASSSSEQVDGLRVACSQIAMENHSMLTSTSALHVVTTSTRLQTVGVNLNLGQLDMQGALLSLHSSALTIFI